MHGAVCLPFHTFSILNRDIKISASQIIAHCKYHAKGAKMAYYFHWILPMTPCAMEWEQFKLPRPVCLSFSESVGEAVVNVSALELL